MPRVSEEDLHNRRAEILDGARRCFGQYGYEGATVRRLEGATGKSRGAIFHHFDDKEGLFFALAREDAQRQADVISSAGLVQVMHEILDHPERHDWLATRLEVVRLVRTDPGFRERWQDQQEIVDSALRQRLASTPSESHRDAHGVEVHRAFLETILDGLISRLSMGEDPDLLRDVLGLAERAVREN
ncbi:MULTISPECIES: TetR/AcrR family transcriptional regulator [Corynebacterium]|uniref:TetR/AcrR family transcriptional regulator n=1 Tax=Corynebacterium glucuronolyticum TaxID=39791 RepID=A0A7T4JUC4_9CORY|nr:MULTISPECIES: TetR/AcrR family transcriptional regulator [Corynebacterium]MCT1442916.1 TetR/AcrR family transcriptional regulator [Corynebacterium glucuronolyticum]MCT1562638.1 TetR/AcrR family transcriptional regulator [Corynebacterium glucuronolyticum]QQB45723.1 TetR/AcrR family transcriptional regulator [Corynebacterium glucuronolyticum]QQU87347.1 TetR/AcrR family transcriptional regulator [Corynebacterium glucuronolyticum]QRO83232.1 TetR/AcrR family transcriptional regulator [Corynebact